MKQKDIRREKGTGNIYQREPGKWVGRLRIGTKADGKAEMKYFSGKTEAEVKKKIREYNKASDPSAKEKVIVSDYIDNWLKTYKRDSLKPSSYDRLESTVNVHIKPALGDIQLPQLGSDDIQKLLNDLKAKGKSYSTIKKVHDCLGDVLNHALIKEDIVRNPMLLVQMPEKKLFEQKQIRVFTEQESSAIIEECRRVYSTGRRVYSDYGEVFVLMLNTGIRVGEVTGLKKSDWDQKKKTLHIQRNAQLVLNRDSDGNATEGRQLILSSTKTYSGDRVIPLNKAATIALHELCEAHPESEFVVCNKDGKNVPAVKIEKAFGRLMKRIGLDGTTHSLRHTFASTLFANGVDVKTVSQLLGHASIQITLNTYIHLINKVDHAAVTKLDEIF